MDFTNAVKQTVLVLLLFNYGYDSVALSWAYAVSNYWILTLTDTFSASAYLQPLRPWQDSLFCQIIFIGVEDQITRPIKTYMTQSLPPLPLPPPLAFFKGSIKAGSGGGGRGRPSHEVHKFLRHCLGLIFISSCYKSPYFLSSRYAAAVKQIRDVIDRFCRCLCIRSPW